MRPLRLLPVMILLVSACAQPAPGPTPTVTVTTSASEEHGGTRSPDPTTPNPTTTHETTTQTEDFARERARELLNNEIYSALGLELDLIGEGFSRGEARRAVDSLDVDWREQAALAVGELSMFTMNSRIGMMNDLKAGGFTQEEAEYGVDNVYVDYYEKAHAMAHFLSYNMDHVLYEDIRQLLIDEHGFLPEEADWAIENLHPDAVG